MALESVPVVTSFWGDADEAEGLVGALDIDVLVVGGGLAGLSSAYHLLAARPSLSVAVLEARYVGYGASGRNFGSVPQLGRSDPDLIEQRLGEEETRFVLDHQARMLTDFEQLLRRESIECGYERSRVLLLATDETSAERATFLRDQHQRLGYPSIWLDADEARRCVNLPNRGGLSCGRQAYVDPLRLTRGYGAAVRAKGAQILESSAVVGLARSGDTIVASTANGEVRARTCVLATNAFSPGLGVGVGAITPVYTYVIATAPLTDGQRSALGWDELRHRQVFDAGHIGEYYYMQLRPNGQFLMGGGIAPASPDGRKLPAHDDQTQYRRIHEEMVRRFPDLAEVEITAAWGGPLGMTASGLPTTAWIDDGVLLNAAYNGRGVLMSSMSGVVVANRILGRDPDYAVDPDYDRYARDLLEAQVGEIRVDWAGPAAGA